MKGPALIDRQQPLLGFDLGTHMVKLMQLTGGHKRRVIASGSAVFPSEAVVEGIIVDPEDIAAVVKPLLENPSVGRFTARRAAVALPVNKVFTRVLNLPVMSTDDLAAAIKLEAEQYIPVPLPDLYIDHEVIEAGSDGQQVLMVAAPRAIVDSYIKLFDICGLEPVFIESSLAAVTRAVIAITPVTQATLVADFGSSAIDISIYDKAIRLTDTIPMGGDNLTSELAGKLEISYDQAQAIKVRFGMAKSGLQPKVQAILAGPLGQISAEMKRVMKFYQDRGGDERGVKAVVITGGSAGMPGLPEYFEQQLGVPVSIANAWDSLEATKHASAKDAAMYTTAIGLARLEGTV